MMSCSIYMLFRETDKLFFIYLMYILINEYF